MDPKYENFLTKRGEPTTTVTGRIPTYLKDALSGILAIEGGNENQLVTEGIARVILARSEDPDFERKMQEGIAKQAAEAQEHYDYLLAGVKSYFAGQAQKET